MKNKLSVSLLGLAILLAISVILSGCGGDKATTEAKTFKCPEIT